MVRRSATTCASTGRGGRLAHHLVDHGSDGLVIAGTTGEASARRRGRPAWFARGARGRGRRATVVAGTSTNDTAHSVHLTPLRRGRRRGPGRHALLHRPAARGSSPTWPRSPTSAAGDRLHPFRRTVNMPRPDRPAGGIPGIVAVKRANPDPGIAPGLRRRGGLRRQRRRLLSVMEQGGAGIISVASHLVGEEMAASPTMRAGATSRTPPPRRRAGRALRGPLRHDEPHPHQGGPRDDRTDPSARLRLPLVEATRQARHPAHRAGRRGILSRA
jgi:4-hydroxy-tetrahydrodipicolinate synthase